MIKYLSFDLQGVLSASDFSDSFWLNILPSEYARAHHISIQAAKTMLKKEFAAFGKYDIRYYDDQYWAKQLGFETLDVLKRAERQPTLHQPLLHLIAHISLPKIIISTTTRVFIDYELGDAESLFTKTYSCVDDFSCGGKQPMIYKTIAKQLGVQPNEILHIGDNVEMDITNALSVGLHAMQWTGNIDQLIATLKDAGVDKK